MYRRFNTDIDTIFTIDNYQLNTPLNIKVQDNNKIEYLSCAEFNNVVDFYYTDDNSNRQKWIIEKGDNKNFYIKSAFNRSDSCKYLGYISNNNVYLYENKERSTLWSIFHIYEDVYSIVKYE